INANITQTISGSVAAKPITASADGKRVAYFTSSTALSVWDANSNANIYSTSAGSAAVSPSGTRLLYQNGSSLNIRDLTAKTNLLVCSSTVPIKSSCPWSGDGRYVAFATASSLVAGDINGTNDIYLLDYQTGSRTLVSVDQTGAASAAGVSDSPAVSEDGRFVAFRCFATNVAPGIVRVPSLVLFDRLAGTNNLLAT